MTGTGPTAAGGGDPLLAVDALTKAYGSLLAVDGVSLAVPRGERRALIGPNGAGKTTLFDMIGGHTDPSAGTIVFDGTDVTRLPEHRRAALGIAKTFQQSNLLDGLSAFENLAIAVQRHARVAHHCWRPATAYRRVDARTMELLERVGLAGRRDVAAGALSHGERRQLEIANALAIEPRLVLLDEPAAGMSAAETAGFLELVASLPSELTLVLIEHDMGVVFEVASQVTVLQAGRVLMEGSPDEVRGSRQVQEAYLGSAELGELFHVP